MDYDSWNTDGWDAKTLMSLANKAETYLVKDARINQELHGHEGPVNISLGTHATKVNYDDIFDGAEAAGVPYVPDVQDFNQGHGMTIWAKYIGPDGKRQDAAHCYIHPLIESGNYPNLHLLLDSTVSRVIFDGVRAIGVEYAPTSNLKEAASCIAAAKLVVLSAGTLATAPILERSGVGKAENLCALDIKVVSDLPGVGENYQDHNLILYPYKATWTAEESYDGLLSGREDFAEALADNSSKMGWNGVDVCGKIRPSEDEVARLGTNFQVLWDRDFKNKPTRPLVILPMLTGYLGDHMALNEPDDNPTHYLTTGPLTAYPYSRGSIHISSKDLQSPPNFHTGFLTSDFDVTVQVWAYKKQREIVRRSDRYAGEYAPGHPKFRIGSKAACQSRPAVEDGFKTMEERRDLPPIEYDEEDDDAIEEFIRANINSSWHPLGTCKMAPRDNGGVVDKYLNVHGTQNLKCAGKFIRLQRSCHEMQDDNSIFRSFHRTRECWRKHI